MERNKVVNKDPVQALVDISMELQRIKFAVECAIDDFYSVVDPAFINLPDPVSDDGKK